MIASDQLPGRRLDLADGGEASPRQRASGLSAPNTATASAVDPDASPRRDSRALLRHELCTPLNAILGFSDLLAGDEQLGERHRRYAANILAAGTVLLRRVNLLLEQATIAGDAC